MPTPPQIPIPRFIHYSGAPAEQQLSQPVFSSLSRFPRPLPVFESGFWGILCTNDGQIAIIEQITQNSTEGAFHEKESHPAAGETCPPGHAPPGARGGQGAHLRPGPGAGGGGVGQSPGGVPHQVRPADHPGEPSHLLQPDLRGAGGLPAAGGGLEGHDLPLHRGGQRRHRHRSADPLQADH